VDMDISMNIHEKSVDMDVIFISTATLHLSPKCKGEGLVCLKQTGPLRLI